MESSEKSKQPCLCGISGYMVLSCSGACDLGEIADRVARKLRDNNVRKMNCLAVVGAGITASIEGFRDKNILMIDGCPIDCGRKILEAAELPHCHFRVSDLGYTKGETPVTTDVVEAVYREAEIVF